MIKKLSRKIYITDDIDNEAFTKFSRKVAALEAAEIGKQHKTKEPVHIELISGGGDTYSALAFFSRMRASPLKFHVTVYGLVASAAVAILAAGDLRIMTEDAWLMVHEDTTDGLEGLSVSEIERAAMQARRLEDQWATLLASVSTTSYDKWVDLHKSERYLNAAQCQVLGIIDVILPSRSKK